MDQKLDQQIKSEMDRYSCNLDTTQMHITSKLHINCIKFAIKLHLRCIFVASKMHPRLQFWFCYFFGQVGGWEEKWRLKLSQLPTEVEVEAELGNFYSIFKHLEPFQSMLKQFARKFFFLYPIFNKFPRHLTHFNHLYPSKTLEQPCNALDTTL